MNRIAQLYNSGRLIGWPGEEIAKEQFYLLASQPNQKYFVKMLLPVQGDGKIMLFDCTRKLLNKDTENYPQQVGDPFVAGTMVLMSDGNEKPIENIKIGDVVINHKGEQARVTNTIKKQFTGYLVTVELKGYHRQLTATDTHHGMVLPYTQKRFKYQGVERRKFGDLSVGDYMLIPFGIQDYHTDIKIDISNFVKNVNINDNIITRGKRSCKRYITIDANFARLIGLYLAEGGVDHSSVNFSLHVNETLYMSEIKAYAEEVFGVNNVTINKTGNENCRRVLINSSIVRDFFLSFVPGKVHTKSIPTVFFKCVKSIKLALIKGWLDGDGHKKFDRNAVIGYTSSNKLANDMMRLSLSCGLNVKSWSRMRKTRAKVPNTEIGFYGTEPYKIYQDVLPKKKISAILCNNTPYGFARPIKDVTEKYVENHTVYCITTEKEYTAIFNGIAQFQCVSFGAKNACEYLVCVQSVLGVAPTQFRPVFPPYLYGCGRVFIGNRQIGREDGSVGAWQAQAVQQYGVLGADESNVPKYSGSLARKWGYDGPPREFVDLAKVHLVKSAAQINSWQGMVAAVTNGYPCTIASNQGFTMEPGPDGFHQARGNWGHQMSVIGVDNKHRSPYGLILNSWGDVHGHLKDFETGEDLPIGVIRAHAEVIEGMIRQGDTFAYSHMDWFQEQKLSEALFKLI